MTRTFPQLTALVALVALAATIAPARGADVFTTHRLSAQLATEIAVDAIAACAKMTYAVSATVVDADGVTQALVRGDGADVHTLRTAHDKAYTAVSYGRPGSVTGKSYADNPSGVILKEPHLLPGDGGLPIKIGTEVVAAALGISGSPARTRSAETLRSTKFAGI